MPWEKMTELFKRRGPVTYQFRCIDEGAPVQIVTIDPKNDTLEFELAPNHIGRSIKNKTKFDDLLKDGYFEKVETGTGEEDETTYSFLPKLSSLGEDKKPNNRYRLLEFTRNIDDFIEQIIRPSEQLDSDRKQLLRLIKKTMDHHKSKPAKPIPRKGTLLTDEVKKAPPAPDATQATEEEVKAPSVERVRFTEVTEYYPRDLTKSTVVKKEDTGSQTKSALKKRPN